jgi:peptide/nickel transport system substrate-binding protein
MKRINLLIGAIVIVAAVVGATFIYSWLTPPPPVPLKILRIATVTEPLTLDPHNERTQIDMIIFTQIHETLVRAVWEGGEYKLNPGLATSWELVNSTCWKFNLRKGVKFHDGTPFNASAVKYNFDKLLDMNRPSTMARTFIQGFYLKSVQVQDDYTILMYTQVPSPLVINSLAQCDLCIISPTASKRYGDKDYGRNPVGTGPFRFVEWVQGQYVKLGKNKDYWGKAAALDEVIFKTIPDDGTRFMSFLAGEIDVASNVPPQRVSEVMADPKKILIKAPSTRVIFFQLNTLKYPFNDLRVRQAVAHALDRDSIVKNILLDMGKPATLLIAPGVMFRLPEKEYGAGGPYPYDPNKAKQLLAQAGWADTNGDGIVEKDGKPFEVTLTNPSGRYLKDKEICEVMAEQFLKNIGIKVKIQVLDSAAWLNKVSGGDFEMSILGWTSSGMEVDLFFRRVFRTVPSLGRAQWSCYSNPQFDEILDKGGIEMDPAKRAEYYMEAQRIVMKDSPVVPIYFTYNLYATTSAVQGFDVRVDELFDLSNTTIKTA